MNAASHVRSMLGAALVLAACWNGADASHKPCAGHDQCGRGQMCIDDFCDGPPPDNADDGSTSVATSTSGTSTGEASTSGTDTGEMCAPPTPTSCDPAMRVMAPEGTATALPSTNFGRATAVAAGAFAGDGRPDLAVMSFDEGNVELFENAWPSWQPAIVDYTDVITDVRDFVAGDIDDDGMPELLVLSQQGAIEIATWDGTAATVTATLMLPASDLISFELADVRGDARPDLVVSGKTAVYLVSNVDGVLIDDDATSIDGEFDEPSDTLVVGSGADARIIIPESGDTTTMGVANQVVHVLRVEDEMPMFDMPLGTTFQNPWALAAGDFLGGDELEIAVAERRLDQPPENDATIDPTMSPGRLRFFRIGDGGVTEVGAPLEVGIGTRSLAAADLDCDGKTDLVIGNSGRPGMADGQAQVLFGSCASSASPDELLGFPEVDGTGIAAGFRMAVGDFDDDGLLEVAIPDFGEDTSNRKRIVFVGVQEAG